MTNRSTGHKMACGAFGLSVCAFLAPGLHYSMTLGAQSSGIAIEAGLLGLACGVLGLVLAFAAKAAMSRSRDDAGANWVNAAKIVSILGVLWWTMTLLMRAA